MKKQSKKKWFCLLSGATMLAAFFYAQNNALTTSKYTVQSEKLPASFHGYKIVHLSDLHNKSFGKDQDMLVKKVKKEKPDTIVFTGDLVDSNRYDAKPSLTLMKKLVDIVPVYYVTGNHEWRSGEYPLLERELNAIGVQVMRNESKELTIGKDTIALFGIDDASGKEDTYTVKERTDENIHIATESMEQDNFNMLLSHRPEMLSLYSDHNLDVVFSGHAHGGQIRIPFIGGVIAPSQGFFPSYTEGAHKRGDTTVIISRGLGNSGFPLRILNRPEIVVVTLANPSEAN